MQGKQHLQERPHSLKENIGVFAFETTGYVCDGDTVEQMGVEMSFDLGLTVPAVH